MVPGWHRSHGAQGSGGEGKIGGREAAASKTASKASRTETYFIRESIGFRRGLLGVCPSNRKIDVFGGSKTIPCSPIVDPGAFYEVDF